jgi:hypothetical protein
MVMEGSPFFGAVKIVFMAFQRISTIKSYNPYGMAGF